MKRLSAGFALSVVCAAALAQSVPSVPANALPAAEGARQSVPPSTTPGATQSAQPPQRGFIAPVIDIRIQGEGVSLPRPAAEPPAEKPKPAAEPAK
jgi:hypothetical protein